MDAPTRLKEILLWLAVAVGIGTADWFGNGSYSLFLALPVAYAAQRMGWKGGVATATVSMAFIASNPEIPSVRAASFCWALFLLGIVLGLVADRERKRDHPPPVGNPGALNDKVLANLEGMKRAERLSALGQLSAGLAHEIRNPLASISGAAAILQRDRELDPKQSKCVSIIVSECQRLDRLLSNFLNFARPRPPRFQLVDLQPILENTVALAGHGIHGKTVHLDMRIDDAVPSVDCDPEQLEQVLLNLMLNAIEASPEGGTVTLAARVEGSGLTIKVVDLGHGVATAHVDRLFDPFFTTKEHGTGLGLPVAHQIVRQMGGSLLAHRNQGQGMTFSVTLPTERTDA